MCLCFLLAKTVIDLNLIERDTACWSMIQFFLTNCVARDRFDNIPDSEASSSGPSLLTELLYVVSRMHTNSGHLLSGMLRTMLLVLTHSHICAWR